MSCCVSSERHQTQVAIAKTKLKRHQIPRLVALTVTEVNSAGSTEQAPNAPPYQNLDATSFSSVLSLAVIRAVRHGKVEG